MKLNWFSPLAPAKTGIADFLSGILPELSKRARLTLWTDQTVWDRSIENFAPVRTYQLDHMPWVELNGADLNIYNLGNNHLFHGSIWQVARRQPGAVILHDLRLHEFFDSLYRHQWQDTDGYLAQMETHYGEEGRNAAAESVKNGSATIHSLSQRYPLTALALENSLGVLVHTQEAYEELKLANRWVIACAPLAYSPRQPSPRDVQRQPRIRANGQPYRLIVFGFINRNRRLDVLLETLALFPRKDRFVLDIYGEIWDPGYIRKQIQTLGLGRQVTLRGFASESELDVALSKADLAVNLRYPTMGEASISQLRIWAHALPTLVTRVGWYGGLPETVVAHVRPEHEADDIHDHLSAFLAAPDRFSQMGEAGQRLLAEQHSVEKYVEAVLDLAAQAREFRPRAFAHKLAERVGIAMSPWAEALASDDTLRTAAEEILALTNGDDNKSKHQAKSAPA
ncbi:MAG TPA: glycosyltransferase [Pyrinomonadaceae bacterium]|nr:glycosyltransferase [Pyrinomonadaceae bacterium]